MIGGRKRLRGRPPSYFMCRIGKRGIRGGRVRVKNRLRKDPRRLKKEWQVISGLGGSIWPESILTFLVSFLLLF